MIDERVHAPGVDAGVVASWVTAWLNGAVPGDDVASALGAANVHRIVGTRAVPEAPGRAGVPAGSAIEPGGAQLFGGDVPFSAALIAWRRRGAQEVRLVLPVPGDVRGVPANDPAFTAAALAAGQALVGAGLAMVPRAVGSGQLVTWDVYEVGPAPPDPLTVRQAQVDLAEAIRETASVLAGADLGAPGLATPAALQAARRAGERPELPPGHPGPAVALLAQALRLRAVLDLAVRDPRGGAVDRVGMATREAALRPLLTAVRRARLAACNAWTEPVRPS